MHNTSFCVERSFYAHSSTESIWLCVFNMPIVIYLWDMAHISLWFQTKINIWCGLAPMNLRLCFRRTRSVAKRDFLFAHYCSLFFYLWGLWQTPWGQIANLLQCVTFLCTWVSAVCANVNKLGIRDEFYGIFQSFIAQCKFSSHQIFIQVNQ